MVRWFLLGWGLAAGASIALVGLVWGTDEARRLALAWTTSLPGHWASLIVAEKSLSLPPVERTPYLAAGPAIRLLTSLPLAAGYWCVILSVQQPSFWVWFVITYALSLAGDVWLTLRVLRSDRTVRSQDSSLTS
jgi:hypothetical protein